MKKISCFFIACILAVCLAACNQTAPTAQESVSESYSNNSQDIDVPLTPSDTFIKISTESGVAIFQLYDTRAAEDLVQQLPLELELSNFRDAQWMFYPPEKLSVTDEEIYRNGKKGELSYYEPWGDVFMLYEDFQSGDDMHRLGFCISGLDEIAAMTGTAAIQIADNTPQETEMLEEENDMEYDSFYITAGNTTFTADFSDNSSAEALKELLAEGPVTVDMQDYGNFEKVGPLPQSLPRNDQSITTDAGDIILYQGSSIVIYYDANSWNFTRLGKIENITKQELLDALGNGDVSVTFSLTNPQN